MKNILLLITFFTLFSCKNEKTANADSYALEASGQIKSFTLDSDVRYNPFYLYTFSDDRGKDYLSFLNYRTNQILFYDLKTSEFLFKINLDAEGPNGVVMCSGFYIKDFENIYVSSYAYPGLIKVDTARNIVQRIPYGTTDRGYKVIPSYTPSSHPYVPPILIDDKIYITQNAVDRFHPVADTPLSVMIDTLRKSCEGLPLTYSVLSEEELQADDTGFSRIYDGKNFIYSFHVAEDIITASVDHKEIKRIKVKSQYIDSPTAKQEDGERGPRQNLELARYGDLLYDPYREVYYRFAYPQTSLDDNMRWMGKSVYGRKKFSVIILNKEFQVIGETLFPESIYNSYVFFVHKDGLYISRDYQMIYDQSEDYMTFELFDLVEKK